jgi:hypothetical protein
MDKKFTLHQRPRTSNIGLRHLIPTRRNDPIATRRPNCERYLYWLRPNRTIYIVNITHHDS